MEYLFFALWLVSVIVMFVAIFKRKSISRKQFWIALVSPTILFILFAANLPSAEPTVEPTATATTEEVEVVAKTPLEKLEADIKKSLGKETNRDVPRDTKVTYNKEEKILNVTFAMDDNLFADSRIRGTFKEILSIIKLVQKSDLEVDMLTAYGTWPFVDKYNKPIGETNAVGIVMEEALHKLNIDKYYDPENLFNVAEVYYVHPSMK